MAARYFSVSAAGVVAETPNTTAATIPTGAVVIGVDTSVVTTKASLRNLLDAMYNQVVASNLLS